MRKLSKVKNIAECVSYPDTLFDDDPVFKKVKSELNFFCSPPFEAARKSQISQLRIQIADFSDSSTEKTQIHASIVSPAAGKMNNNTNGRFACALDTTKTPWEYSCFTRERYPPWGWKETMVKFDLAKQEWPEPAK